MACLDFSHRPILPSLTKEASLRRTPCVLALAVLVGGLAFVAVANRRGEIQAEATIQVVRDLQRDLVAAQRRAVLSFQEKHPSQADLAALEETAPGLAVLEANLRASEKGGETALAKLQGSAHGRLLSLRLRAYVAGLQLSYEGGQRDLALRLVERNWNNQAPPCPACQAGHMETEALVCEIEFRAEAARIIAGYLARLA